MNIGFIGVGNMGAGMANNLIKAGHTLTINEIARERATPLLEQGAKWADSPKEVAEASEITFTSLPAPVDVEAVALGDGGILEGSKPGSVYIAVSSNSVSLVRRTHGIFEDKQVHMLDAPVSGWAAGAHLRGVARLRARTRYRGARRAWTRLRHVKVEKPAITG